MKKYLFLLIALLVAVAQTGYADFYTWEDESGATHITDYPPPQNQKTMKIKVYKNDAGAPSESRDEQQAKDEKTPTVVLYTKNDCPDCDKAREFLNSKKIAFTEYNMDIDKSAAVKRKKIDDGDDVPFAVINRNHVYGFSETIYNRALKPAP